MSGDAILAFLMGLWAPLKDIFSYLGLALVILQTVAFATQTKRDDAVVQKAYAIPLLGDILKALSHLSPWKP